MGNAPPRNSGLNNHPRAESLNQYSSMVNNNNGLYNNNRDVSGGLVKQPII
jgi:hypothetical protein